MKAFASILLLFTIISIISISPFAFAEVIIATSDDSGFNMECGTDCYLPSTATVDVGGKVIFSNPVGFHTFTAGTWEAGMAPSPSGEFDVTLAAEESAEWIPETAGEYPYYCSLHMWMTGVIIVQEAEAEPVITMATVMKPDQMMAEIMTGDGIANEEMTIDLTITDLEGNGVEHITYNIKATQGSEILLNDEGHMHKGTITNNHVTSALPVDASDTMPIAITVESVGFGHNEQYVEFSGEIATKQVVPEFGTIAMMVLVVAIISIVAVTAKSGLNIMPRI